MTTGQALQSIWMSMYDCVPLILAHVYSVPGSNTDPLHKAWLVLPLPAEEYSHYFTAHSKQTQ